MYEYCTVRVLYCSDYCSARLYEYIVLPVHSARFHGKLTLQYGTVQSGGTVLYSLTAYSTVAASLVALVCVLPYYEYGTSSASVLRLALL